MCRSSILFSNNNCVGCRYSFQVVIEKIIQKLIRDIHPEIEFFKNWNSKFQNFFFRQFGRKILHLIPEFFITISCITIIVIIITGNSDGFKSLVRVLTLTSGAICSGLWVVASLLAVELFSTSVRTLAGGFCSFWARVAGILAPQLLLLVSLAANLI